MTFGLGVLRLPPTVFWAMTLPELAAALKAYAPEMPATPSVENLAMLMQAFPDKSPLP
jgi:uncharacterized phage protein (TIGR02216 family)